MESQQDFDFSALYSHNLEGLESDLPRMQDHNTILQTSPSGLTWFQDAVVPTSGSASLAYDSTSAFEGRYEDFEDSIDFAPNTTVPTPFPATTISSNVYMQSDNASKHQQQAELTSDDQVLQRQAVPSQGPGVSDDSLSKYDFTVGQDFWEKYEFHLTQDGEVVHGTNEQLIGRYPAFEEKIMADFGRWTMQRTASHIEDLPVPGIGSKVKLSHGILLTTFELDRKIPDLSLCSAYPPVEECTKVKVKNDDWQTVENMMSQVVDQYLAALSAPFDRSPKDSEGQPLNLEKQAAYLKTQKAALNKLTNDLSTPLGTANATTNCRKLAYITVCVNKFGPPTYVYDQNKLLGAVTKNRNWRFAKMLCSKRVERVTAALTANKRIGADLMKGANLEKLARDPQYVVSEKISYMQSNQKRDQQRRRVPVLVSDDQDDLEPQQSGGDQQLHGAFSYPHQMFPPASIASTASSATTSSSATPRSNGYPHTPSSKEIDTPLLKSRKRKATHIAEDDVTEGNPERATYEVMPARLQSFLQTSNPFVGAGTPHVANLSPLAAAAFYQPTPRTPAVAGRTGRSIGDNVHGSSEAHRPFVSPGWQDGQGSMGNLFEGQFSRR